MQKGTTALKLRAASVNNDRAAAAELALKIHVLEADPEILAATTNGRRRLGRFAELVDLTEAPEDAVCSLVTDLLHYCHREKINWTQDVINRASQHFRTERAQEN